MGPPGSAWGLPVPCAGLRRASGRTSRWRLSLVEVTRSQTSSREASMTTGSISAAMHGGDLLQLARLLDTHEASLEDLEALIRREPATRHLALLHVERRLGAPA